MGGGGVEKSDGRANVDVAVVEWDGSQGVYGVEGRSEDRIGERDEEGSV